MFLQFFVSVLGGNRSVPVSGRPEQYRRLFRGVTTMKNIININQTQEQQKQTNVKILNVILLTPILFASWQTKYLVWQLTDWQICHWSNWKAPSGGGLYRNTETYIMLFILLRLSSSIKTGQDTVANNCRFDTDSPVVFSKFKGLKVTWDRARFRWREVRSPLLIGQGPKPYRNNGWGAKPYLLRCLVLFKY